MARVAGLKHNYIGKTIKKWLIDADMNQSDLADAMGIPRQMMSYKIRNNSIDYKDLLDIIEACDVPDEEIVRALRK
jgi:transcriptional regulator with XRE-family HTH domain